MRRRLQAIRQIRSVPGERNARGYEDSRLRGNDVGGCGSDVGAGVTGWVWECGRGCLARVRAGTSFRCGSSDSVALCRFPSTAGVRAVAPGVRSRGGPAGDAARSWYVSRMGTSPWVVVSLSRHRFRIVREFCFVKCDAGGTSVSDAGGWIPAYAGMTWVGAGVTETMRGNDGGGTGERRRQCGGRPHGALDSRLRGNDVGGCGSDGDSTGDDHMGP